MRGVSAGVADSERHQQFVPGRLGHHDGQALVEAIISKYIGLLCARAAVHIL